MRNIVFVLLLLCTATWGNAQNGKSIRFEENKTWKEVVKQAKKEKKLIFLDCYTSWCGPCKYLAIYTFTDDGVADFFNANFVNVKLDMEKNADGLMLKKQFGVSSYPTLIFVDPRSGKAVHRMVGAGKPEWLIAGAKLAMDPDKNLRGLMERYESGERDPGLIRDYAGGLFTAYARDEAARVACEYLNTLPVDSLVIQENWQMIRRIVNDPLSPVLQRVMKEREKFYTALGQKEVDAKLEKSISVAVKEFTGWNLKRKPFDEKGNQELVDYLKSIDFYAAPAGLAGLYTAAYVRKKDFRGMLNKMDEVFSYNLLRNEAKLSYFRDNIRSLENCEDKELIDEGIRRIDGAIGEYGDDMDKSNLMKVKALLQTKKGDQAGAEVSAKEADRYYQKFRNRKK